MYDNKPGKEECDPIQNLNIQEQQDLETTGDFMVLGDALSDILPLICQYLEKKDINILIGMCTAFRRIIIDRACTDRRGLMPGNPHAIYETKLLHEYYENAQAIIQDIKLELNNINHNGNIQQINKWYQDSVKQTNDQLSRGFIYTTNKKKQYALLALCTFMMSITMALFLISAIISFKTSGSSRNRWGLITVATIVPCLLSLLCCTIICPHSCHALLKPTSLHRDQNRALQEFMNNIGNANKLRQDNISYDYAANLIQPYQNDPLQWSIEKLTQEADGILGLLQRELYFKNYNGLHMASNRTGLFVSKDEFKSQFVSREEFKLMVTKFIASANQLLATINGLPPIPDDRTPLIQKNQKNNFINNIKILMAELDRANNLPNV